MLLPRIMIRLTGRKCLPGLIEHYEPVAKGVMVVEAALKEYAVSGNALAYQALVVEIDTLEGQADKIKRRIRNHLPRDVFMEVDKTLFLNYTRSQDNILDAAQEALNWLGMRNMDLPDGLLRSARELAREACRTVELLKVSLESTMALIYGQTADRSGVKDTVHEVRLQHHRATKVKRRLVKEAFDSEAGFKDIYQFAKFVEHLHVMSHSAEGAADVLRAMMAR